MANLNIDSIKNRTFDAIVIGSGISGGWASKELTEAGLKTLMLERGRDVKHVVDYPTTMSAPWEVPHSGRLPLKVKNENPVASKTGYAFDEYGQHFFVKDSEHPYTQVKPFDWTRGYQVGGKSLMWARWVQRWNETNFEENVLQDIGVDWPIRYKDLAPWYSYVEKFIGVSGNKDGLSSLPDGEFLPPFEMNCLENHFQKSVSKHYSDRNFIISRTANLSEAKKIHTDLGRTTCQSRNWCNRGCPFGAYFSTQSSTLPAAMKTGNLSVRPFSVVESIIYDEKKGKATGVRVIDSNSLEMTEYYAKIIFVNASTLNSTLILMNSTSNRFPNGLGNDSGSLGHYLMDHNYRASIKGVYEGKDFDNQYYYGRRPTGTYVPRFRNLGTDKQKDFLRGYAFACAANRDGWQANGKSEDFGAEFKDRVSKPGSWNFSMTGMGEMLPDFKNHISLDHNKKDKWGIPTLKIDCQWGENEDKMVIDALEQAKEMMENAGIKVTSALDNHQAPGLAIHEMGTARMGNDPKTSVLNAFNQIHSCKNVFVTDGSAMASSACQNPSLTYMAMTARAANFAIKELKKGNFLIR